MSVNGLFNKNMDLLERSLNLRARRHEVIISNIANMDTPHYKAFDLEIEAALKRSKTSLPGELPLARTDGQHLSGGSPPDNTIQPRMVEVSQQATLRGDGNTVNMDTEMAHLAENNLMYQVSAQLIYRKFQDLKDVIMERKS
jgi:flagellar basal-body rod protein FlgB